MSFSFYCVFLVLMTTCRMTKCDSPTRLYSKHRVIRAVPQTEEHLQVLQTLSSGSENQEIEFWTLPRTKRTAVDVQLSSKSFRNISDLLRSHGITFKTLISDLQTAIEEQNDEPREKSNISWFDKYHSLDEIVAHLKEVITEKGDLVRMLRLGKSHEGREQYAVQMQSDPDVTKPLVFINCGIHAREWVSPATCLYTIHQLVYQFSKDASVTELINKVDVVILPVVNVDGYVYSWEKDRLWRKNRRPNPGYPECVGTDLNRNWEFGWGKPGASSHPCSQIYHGKHAMSESEVQNVAKYLQSQKKRLIAYLDVHSYGQVWTIPWGYTNKHVKDYDELMKVGKAAVEAIKLFGGDNTTYSLGQAHDVIYTESGTTKDYVYGTLEVKYTFSMELRDTGKNGFILPNRLILPTAREAFEGIKAMIQNIDLSSKLNKMSPSS